EERHRLRVALLADRLDGGLREEDIGVRDEGAQGGAGLRMIDSAQDLDAEEGSVPRAADRPGDHRGQGARCGLPQRLHRGRPPGVGLAARDEFDQAFGRELFRGDLGGAVAHDERGIGQRLLDGAGRLDALPRALQRLEEDGIGAAHADFSGRRRCSTWAVSSVTFAEMPFSVSATRWTASWFWRATTLMSSMALSTCSPPARTWTVASATCRVRSEIRSTASSEERTARDCSLALSVRRRERLRM